MLVFSVDGLKNYSNFKNTGNNLIQKLDKAISIF